MWGAGANPCRGGSVQGEPGGVQPGVTTAVGKLRQAEGSEGLRLQLRGGSELCLCFPTGKRNGVGCETQG